MTDLAITPAETMAPAAATEPSYARALKSAATIGGSSIVKIVLGIIRVKFVAVAIGPAGVGLIGAYTSITTMISGLAGMGIPTSGVREVADAVGQRDNHRVARLVTTIRRATMILAVVGMFVMIGLAPWLSEWTFGDRSHVLPLMMLSLVVVCGTVASGQMVLLQGTRRIGDLVRVNIVGALLGTVVGVPVVWIWGIRGIVPFLVIVQAMAFATSWWFVRKLPVTPAKLSLRKVVTESTPIMKFGLWIFVAMIGGNATIYLIRVMLIRDLGMAATGQYQAAANLASMYVGLVLGAMGTDFYPGLASVSNDHQAMTRRINEQAEVALLLAVPGILAVLTLAPVVINIFYSKLFTEAAEILRWQLMGDLFRVISWPLGFAILAKGNGKLNLVTDAMSNGVWLGGTWLGIRWFGVVGAGAGYLVLYVFYWALMATVVGRMIGFRYTSFSKRLLGLFLPAVGIVFMAVEFLPVWWGVGFGAAVTLSVGIYCGNTLAQLVPESKPARMWKSVVAKICLTSMVKRG